MQESIAFIPSAKIKRFTVAMPETTVVPNKTIPGDIERKVVWLLIRLNIFFIACKTIKSPLKILITYKTMLKLKSDFWGGQLKKIYKVGGKYYFNQYVAGWPSKVYNENLSSEIKRYAFPLTHAEKVRFIFLAITRKCPMRCEHCFEWDNLNQKESFTKQDLMATIDMYQKEGVLQFHFSGGEPMVRFKDLVDLVSFASVKSECWVLTSGFNVTKENAVKLKQSGCKGMVISIDHYIPEMHNLFRGHQSSFEMATAAVKAAREAGLVTSLSVCTTKAFIDGGHVMPYIEFARSLGVNFIQMLEPKSTGHYEGKNVLLEEKHIKLLEETFTTVNHQQTYKNYPTLLYHGYHQRRVGCFSGSRSIYIDSAGDVHSCPFCHTKSFNVIDFIRSGSKQLPAKENVCPLYNKIA